MVYDLYTYVLVYLYTLPQVTSCFRSCSSYDINTSSKTASLCFTGKFLYDPSCLPAIPAAGPIMCDPRCEDVGPRLPLDRSQVHP